MIKKMAAIFIASVALLATILGNNFVPWIKTVQVTAGDHLAALVDQYELKLQQAKQIISQYEVTLVNQAKQRSRLKSLVQSVDHSLDESRALLTANRDEIASLRTRLVEHGFVSTRSGEMSPEHVQAAIERNGRAMKHSQQRIDSLMSMRTPCQQQLTVLEQACESAPIRIAELQGLCSDLKSKIVLAREMQTWTTQTRSMQAANGNTSEDITQSLHSIEVEFDCEIAGLSALLSIQNGSATDPSRLSTDSLINQCELALNTRQ